MLKTVLDLKISGLVHFVVFLLLKINILCIWVSSMPFAQCLSCGENTGFVSSIHLSIGSLWTMYMHDAVKCCKVQETAKYVPCPLGSHSVVGKTSPWTSLISEGLAVWTFMGFPLQRIWALFHSYPGELDGAGRGKWWFPSMQARRKTRLVNQQGKV